MRFNNHFLQTGIHLLSRLSPTPTLCKSINSSSHTTSSDWVRHNQLFQRHPKLHSLEEQCRRNPQHLQHLISHAFVSGLHRNPFVMGRVLYLSLIELGAANPALGVRVFHSTQKPNIFSWNTIIRFFAGSDPPTSFRYYVKMLRTDSFPDRYTFTFLLQACGAILDLGLVQRVHCHVLKLVSPHCLFVANSLLHAYLSHGSEVDAQLLFDEMPQRDVISWTCFISGLVSLSNFSKSFLVFRDLISGEHPTGPNSLTIISTISGCARFGSTNLTKSMHSYLQKTGFLELDISIVNSLIDAYAKCGDLCYSRKICDTIPISKRDLFSWTSMISAYAMLGQGPEALDTFFKMEKECKFTPDSVTFIAILSTCAHSGLVEEGLHIFESMVTRYKIENNVRHYGCVVDLFSRAGLLERAFRFVENMPMEPNLTVLGSLLNGCCLHKNTELGEAVMRKIEVLSKKAEKGGFQVLLSNIYANERRWGEVVVIREETRQRMEERKPPGRSWIQIQGEVCEFVARKRSDGETMELHVVVEELEKLSRSS